MSGNILLSVKKCIYTVLVYIMRYITITIDHNYVPGAKLNSLRWGFSLIPPLMTKSLFHEYVKPYGLGPMM